MSNEIKGEGNSYTAEFWEYDPRLGRRWNVDPKGNESISDYSAFLNNPIYIIDPLGDTIRQYWAADAKKQTLADKGGTQENIGNTLHFGGVRIVPVISDSKKTAGFYIYDNEVENPRFPLLQMDFTDLGEFVRNYKSFVPDARNFYSMNYVESGQKKMSAALFSERKINWDLYWEGAKEINKKAWNDQVFVVSFLTASAGAATHAKSINSVDDVFRNPYALKGTSSEEIRKLAALDPRWKVGTLGKGNHAGTGLTVREWNKNKTDFTHKYIQFHPDTTRPNHFGGQPY